MTQELIADILSENLIESKEHFNSILSEKMAVKLSETKIAVAQNLFGGPLDEVGEIA